jgi:hypothetical protein
MKKAIMLILGLSAGLSLLPAQYTDWYKGQGRLKKVTSTYTEGTTETHSFTWDKKGKLLQMEQSYMGEQGYTEKYGYDPSTGKMTERSYWYGEVLSSYEEYVWNGDLLYIINYYDGEGNRTYTSLHTWSDDGQRLLSVAGYQTDDVAGTALWTTLEVYQYNNSGIETAYAYYADGNRQFWSSTVIKGTKEGSTRTRSWFSPEMGSDGSTETLYYDKSKRLVKKEDMNPWSPSSAKMTYNKEGLITEIVIISEYGDVLKTVVLEWEKGGMEPRVLSGLFMTLLSLGGM